jgi:hypothetical protein
VRGRQIKTLLSLQDDEFISRRLDDKQAVFDLIRVFPRLDTSLHFLDRVFLPDYLLTIEIRCGDGYQEN